MGILAICLGAALGALLRWWLGSRLNTVFPSLPLGTLTANLLGGFLIGLFIGFSKHVSFSETTRLTLITGFLGGLTTFSTFSAETLTLLVHQQWALSCAIITCHVVGSLLLTALGFYLTKVFSLT